MTFVSDDGLKIDLYVDQPVIVEKVHILVRECPERELAETEFLVEYLAADDLTNQTLKALKVSRSYSIS